ncbi:MAG: Helix-turn-helix domain protein [Elusimicrobia bacterium ADurb.Bin231]|nr:MAG: Helix-turn-helix domain protein [Elusimicrobia bacterium ADurb.Bin231]
MQTKLLNINELAEYLGIKISTVYSWVNQRKIPYVKVGRLVKFDQVDIDKWIAEQKVAEANLDYFR